NKEMAFKLLWTFCRTLSERLRETNEKIAAFFSFTGRY
ncbi:MAG: cyclic nucleotide-binding domain-containing protein, partial [Nitrospirae bacterium]|nr:cyclic nucleotide-binding domain-containing protein [Nitrospirota bacterium]